MNVKELEPYQLQRLLDHAKLEELYLDCLKWRKHQQHFLVNDPLYEAVKTPGRRRSC